MGNIRQSFAHPAAIFFRSLVRNGATSSNRYRVFPINTLVEQRAKRYVWDLPIGKMQQVSISASCLLLLYVRREAGEMAKIS